MKKLLILICTAIIGTSQLNSMEPQPAQQGILTFAFNETVNAFKNIPTLLGISTFNGMELQSFYQTLPHELKLEIFTTALAASKDVDETINTLKIFSALHGVQHDKLFNNLKNFTALMDVLTKKFPNLSREDIAEKFNTLTAQEYIKLGAQFFKDVIRMTCLTGGHLQPTHLLSTHHDYIWKPRNPEVEFNMAYALLSEGVDPNFSYTKTKLESKNQRTVAITSQFSLLRETYENILSDAHTNNISKNNKIAIFLLLLNKGAKPDTQLMKYAASLNDLFPNKEYKLLLEYLELAAENK